MLQRLIPAARPAGPPQDFGTALAATHAAGADAFGAPPDGWTGDGYIGTQPLQLRPTERWGAFYAEQRTAAVRRRRHPAAATCRRTDATWSTGSPSGCGTGEFDDDRPPARIHGDLWAGNVIFTATASC